MLTWKRKVRRELQGDGGNVTYSKINRAAFAYTGTKE
jgi:hypothetical protein